MTRPSWDEYFLALATAAATRATCDRARVGCIVVQGRDVIASGYNGAPSGMAHCDQVGHLLIDGHCARTLHAEHNALRRAGGRTVGATVYVTHFPCARCALELIEARVQRVVFGNDYRVSDAIWLLMDEGGIALEGVQDGCK